MTSPGWIAVGVLVYLTGAALLAVQVGRALRRARVEQTRPVDEEDRSGAR